MYGGRGREVDYDVGDGDMDVVGEDGGVGVMAPYRVSGKEDGTMGVRKCQSLGRREVDSGNVVDHASGSASL